MQDRARPISPALRPLLVFVLLCAAAPALPATPCAGPEARRFGLAKGVLVELPGGQRVWEAEGAAIVDFACLEDALVVLVPGRREARALRLELLDGEFRVVEESVARGGAGRHVAAGGGSLAIALEGRSRWSLVFLGPDHPRRGSRVDVSAPIRDLEIAPSGRWLLAALGTSVRAFSWPAGRTGQVFSFDEEVLALAKSATDPALLLVSLPGRVLAVDPEDIPDRGRLPLREERVQAEPAAPEPDPEAAAAVEPPSAPVPAPDPVPIPAPLPAPVPAGAAEPGPDAETPPEPTPLPEPQPAPLSVAEPEPAPHPEPGPSAAPEAEREPAAIPEPAPEAAAQVEPDPVPAFEAAPEALVPPPPVAPAAAEGADPSTSAATREGAIRGVLEGRSELVEFVVVRGPDNLLREFARVEPGPAGTGGRRTFSVPAAPAGRYVVVPMGRAGASLATRPSQARVEVEEGRPVEALRFEVLREW